MKSTTFSSDAGERAGVLPVIVPDLLLAAGELSGALDNGAGKLVVAHLDGVALADLGEHEAEPHPPLGDGAILLARLLLGRALVRKGAPLVLKIVLDHRPDVLELLLDERWGCGELIHTVELVEQLALELL